MSTVKYGQKYQHAAHRDRDRRCLTCHEHGAPYDGPCEWCGYADPRWVDFAAMAHYDKYRKQFTKEQP